MREAGKPTANTEPEARKGDSEDATRTKPERGLAASQRREMGEAGQGVSGPASTPEVVRTRVIIRKLQGWSNRRIAKELGVSHPTVAAILKSSNFDQQVSITGALQAHGMTADYLAECLRAGIDANETKFFQKDGLVTDQRDVVAWGPRREFLDMALRISGAYPKDAVRHEHTGTDGGPILHTIRFGDGKQTS